MKRQEILEAQADQRVVYCYNIPMRITAAYAAQPWLPPRGHGSKVIPADVERDSQGNFARMVEPGCGRWHRVSTSGGGLFYFVPSSALYPA